VASDPYLCYIFIRCSDDLSGLSTSKDARANQLRLVFSGFPPRDAKAASHEFGAIR
jgi:hypothetical protein